MSKRNVTEDKEFLDAAKELVSCLESGDSGQAKGIVDDLTRLSESDMFREIGKITRELHDALVGFEVDTTIADLAENEIPDAKERLNYVIEMTENAANKTLTAIEELMPICEQNEQRLEELSNKWIQFRKKDMSADEFRSLVKEIEIYFSDSKDGAKSLRNKLNDVLMAQDYQDLTGQIIRRVITLVQDVETNLVSVIKITGAGTDNTKQKKNAGAGILEGPQVPNLKSTDAVSNQDEVDDLLSSLGF